MPPEVNLRKLKVRNKRTGQVREILWGGLADPTPDQLRDEVRRQAEPAAPEIIEQATAESPLDPESEEGYLASLPSRPKVETPLDYLGTGLKNFFGGAGQEVLKQKVVEPLGQAVRDIPAIFSDKPGKTLGDFLPEKGFFPEAAAGGINLMTDPSVALIGGGLGILPKVARKAAVLALGTGGAIDVAEPLGTLAGKASVEGLTPEVQEQAGKLFTPTALAVTMVGHGFTKGGLGKAFRESKGIAEPEVAPPPAESIADIERNNLKQALDFLESGKSAYPPADVIRRTRDIREKLGLPKYKARVTSEWVDPKEGTNRLDTPEIEGTLDKLGQTEEWGILTDLTDQADAMIDGIIAKAGYTTRGKFLGPGIIKAKKTLGIAENNETYTVDPTYIASSLFRDLATLPHYRELIKTPELLGREMKYRTLSAQLHEKAGHLINPEARHTYEAAEPTTIEPLGITPETDIYQSYATGRRFAPRKAGEGFTLDVGKLEGRESDILTVKGGPTQQDIFDFLNHAVRDIEGGPLYEFLSDAASDTAFGRVAERSLEAYNLTTRRTPGSKATSFGNIIADVRLGRPLEGGDIAVGGAGKTGIETPPESIPPYVEIPSELASRDALARAEAEAGGRFAEIEASGRRPFEKAEEEVLRSQEDLLARLKKPKKLLPSIKKEDWVNYRAAVEYEGSLKKREFKDLDSLGLGGILQYNADPTALGQRGLDVKKFFDDWSQRLLDVGVGRLNKATGKIEALDKENYLPQLWTDPKDKVINAYKRLGLRPGFTMESVFKNYQAGIDAGLTPKFTTMSDLVGWYESRARKLLADRLFWNELRQSGEIKSVPAGKKPPEGWRLLDPEHFPTLVPKIRYGKREVRQTRNFYAPPKLTEFINNYLQEPELSEKWFPRFGSKVAKAHNIAKNIGLAAGIPGTSINAHGVNELILSALFSENPFKQVPKTVAYLFSPKYAEKRLQQRRELLPFIIKTGGKVGVEDHSFLLDIARQSYKERMKGIWAGAEGVGKKIGRTSFETFLHFFDEPLFQRSLPAIKIDHWINFYQHLRKQGLSEWDAGRASSKVMNNIFGGQNLAEMGRDKNFQNLLRVSIVAPDFLESQARTAGGMVKSVTTGRKDPRMQAYKWGVRNLILYYVGADAINYALSGHHLYQNPAGSEFEVYAGEAGEGANKKERYIKMFNSDLPLVRIPLVMARALFAPDPVRGPDVGTTFREARNRLSLFMRPLLNLLMNVDYKGDPIYGSDIFGRPQSRLKQVGGVAAELTSIAPQQLQAFINYLSGRTGGEESISKSIEAPVKYRRKAKKKLSGLPALPPL